MNDFLTFEPRHVNSNYVNDTAEEKRMTVEIIS